MAQAKGVMERFTAKTMRFSSQTGPAKSVQAEKTISIIVNPRFLDAYLLSSVTSLVLPLEENLKFVFGFLIISSIFGWTCESYILPEFGAEIYLVITFF